MVEIIAHRGASFDAPENTLASIRLAWEQQADAVEIDCHLTSDGHLVVVHDSDLRRVANSDLHVSTTPWNHLQNLDCGCWKGAQWAGERIPLLREVIDLVPAGRRLFIEIKCGGNVIAELERGLARSARLLDGLIVICFEPLVVAASKQQLPHIPAFLLSRTPQPATSTRNAVEMGPHWFEELCDRARRAAADGLDLEAGPAVDHALIEKAEQAGLPCYVWTVDDGQEARRLRDAGVRGITTNRPAWLRQQLIDG